MFNVKTAHVRHRGSLGDNAATRNIGAVMREMEERQLVILVRGL
jgi:hypothetical protein